jgi:YggT family protein
MGYYFVQLINWIEQLLVLLIIVDVVLTYIMSPYHPVRQAIDRIVEPMLNPIRRVVPIIGGFDFSPLVLIILVQLLGTLIKGVLISSL